jgi:rifampicin phosphotransferase
VKTILTCGDRVSAREAGGKFQKQSDMFRAGVNVPPFLVLTGAFYEEVVGPLRGRIQEIVEAVDFSKAEAIQQASASIRELITAASLTPDQRSRILGQCDRMFAPASLVSVRASMIGFREEEGEDTAQNPFAGMSESFLFVPRDEVLQKVLLCMASGFGPESMLYRHKGGMNPTGFSVAVGVQKMIGAAKSFVMFTCNPKTSARQTLIVAGYGAGEGVVQEKVPVDHFFFDPVSGAIRAEIADKDVMMTVGEAGHGLAVAPVPAGMRSVPCLTDDEIRALAKTGAAIERQFRAAQDIEGCITDSGEAFILQSRPVSMDLRRQRVWTNANVTESFPGVTTPLTFTLARYFYRVIFYDCYRMLGISRGELHNQHERLDRMIGFLGGRVYYCLTSFYLLHSQSPLFPIFRAHWEKMMGFLASYEIRGESLLRRTAQWIGACLRLLKAVVVIAYRFATHERDLRRFHAWWENLIAPRRGRNWSGEDPMLLIADFHDVWTQVGNRWGVTLMNDTYLPVLHGWVEGLFRKWKLDEGSGSDALLSGLLCGDDGLISVEIILSAVGLAEDVRGNPALRREFEGRSPEELWSRLDAGLLEPRFAARVKDHLHRFGDRGFQELKMEQPSLRDTPWVLLRMIQSYARDEVTVASYRRKESDVRESAESILRGRLRGSPVKRMLLRLLLSKLRTLIRNRENSRYCRSELFSYSKSIFGAIGGHLADSGVLRSADDVQYLVQEEIFGYIDGTGITENLQALADLRRAERCDNERTETDMQIATLGPVRQNSLSTERPAAPDPRVLVGLGSSSGRVRGIARVVIDPNREGSLGSNAILIAKETDPGWLFLMLSSKALVVERGSMLSHTAITGRKFGIPTVVAVPEATTRIRDGAWIEVDGAAGTVTILDSQEAAHAAESAA